MGHCYKVCNRIVLRTGVPLLPFRVDWPPPVISPTRTGGTPLTSHHPLVQGTTWHLSHRIGPPALSARPPAPLATSGRWSPFAPGGVPHMRAQVALACGERGGGRVSSALHLPAYFFNIHRPAPPKGLFITPLNMHVPIQKTTLWVVLVQLHQWKRNSCVCTSVCQ